MKSYIYLMKNFKIIYITIKNYLKVQDSMKMIINSFVNLLCKVLLALIPAICVQTIMLHTNMNIVIVILILETFLLIIYSFLNTEIDNILLVKRNAELQRFQKIYQNVKYSLLENQEFDDKAQSAYDALCNELGFEGVMRSAYLLFSSSILLIVYGIVVMYHNPLFILIVIISVAMSLHIQSHQIIMRKKIEKSRSYCVRRKIHYDDMCLNTITGKDLRIMKLDKNLLKYYHNTNIEYTKIKNNILNEETNAMIKDVLNKHCRDLFSIILLLFLYFEKSLPISELVFVVNIVLTLSNETQKFCEEISKLNKSAVYTNYYYMFVEEYENKNDKVFSFDEIYKIEFKNVYFKFENSNEYTLKDISFCINRNERIGFVGKNGAGKSTIIKLICGLYSPTSGQILINDININNLNMQQYYDKISCMFQDNWIYATSLYSNITGEMNYPYNLEKIKKITDSVLLERTINNFKGGFNQELRKELHEDGIELSGGTIQKIACARTLAKPADIYIFDEPTSALDAKSEKAMVESFKINTIGKIMVYISHKMYELTDLNCIYVLKDGKIIQSGTHSFLIDHCLEYSELYKTQRQRYEIDEVNYDKNNIQKDI